MRLYRLYRTLTRPGSRNFDYYRKLAAITSAQSRTFNTPRSKL